MTVRYTSECLNLKGKKKSNLLNKWLCSHSFEKFVENFWNPTQNQKFNNIHRNVCKYGTFRIQNRRKSSKTKITGMYAQSYKAHTTKYYHAQFLRLAQKHVKCSFLKNNFIKFFTLSSFYFDKLWFWYKKNLNKFKNTIMLKLRDSLLFLLSGTLKRMALSFD